MEPRGREAAGGRPAAGGRGADRRRSSTGSSPTATSCGATTSGSSCRATTRATCGETLSSRSGTPAGREHVALRRARSPRPTTSSLREHAEWALGRMRARGAPHDARGQLRQTERWIAWMRARRRRVRRARGRRLHRGLPARLRALGVDHARRLRGRRRCCSSRRRSGAPDARPGRSASARRPSTRAIVVAFAVLYSFEYGSPTRWALILVVVEAALRCGLVGGIVAAARAGPVPLVRRALARRRASGRRDSSPTACRSRPGSVLITGLIVGWLVARLRDAAAAAGERAAEAEELRDELGRRVDVLDAANRCARALVVVARARPGLRRVHPRAGGPARVRPRRDRPRRGRQRARHGRRRRRRRRRVFPPGSRCRRGLAARGRRSRRRRPIYRARPAPSRATPRSTRCRALGLRARSPRRCSRARARSGCSRSSGASRTRSRADEVELVGLLGRLVGERRPEHPRLRGRAPHGRGAAAALGAARGLRLARLARAPQPDGGRDRLGADAAAALARARRPSSARRSSR